MQAGPKLDLHFTIRRYRDIAYASSDDPMYRRAGRDRLIEEHVQRQKLRRLESAFDLTAIEEGEDAARRRIIVRNFG